MGQKSRCQVIHIIARLQGIENIDEMMADTIARKIERINQVLTENDKHLIAEKGSVYKNILNKLLKHNMNLEGQKTPIPAHRYGLRKDGTPRLQLPGPGRPRLPEDERKRRRALSKKVWMQCNIEKQHEYNKRWLNKRNEST